MISNKREYVAAQAEAKALSNLHKMTPEELARLKSLYEMIQNYESMKK